MKKNDKVVLKSTLLQFIVAALFSALICLAVYVGFHEKMELVFTLVDRISVVEKESKVEKLEFDTVKRRLEKYPTYGTVFAKLKIPSLGLDLPVFHGDTLDIIKNGVGHYAGSYFPGEGGSIILAAHNSEEHFMHILDMKIGEQFSIETDYGTFVYQVERTKIISDKDEASLPIQGDEELLMMYTCYPTDTVGYKTQRYVVYSKLVGER